jgi:bifunctional UDP-N-acetylglucosamine pyrophosphorylase/glucosamine-1-phosphate N-acetyltransferase
VSLDIVILAAGKGRRMNSDLPKVLQPLAGRPLLGHVLDAAATLEAARLHVVYGHGGERVRAAFADARSLHWHHQAEQLGTGHAVDCAMGAIDDGATVLVLYGDVPLVSPATMERLVSLTQEREHDQCTTTGDGDDAASIYEGGHEALALLTLETDAPAGYGRIVRDGAGAVQRIVEERDADAQTRRICEVNTGVLACNAGLLRHWLARLDNTNAQGEYYLTDVIGMAVADGIAVRTVTTRDENEVLGINDRRQLADAERAYRLRVADRLMGEGVTLADPARLDVRGSLTCGRDVFIDVNCVFEGEVVVGDRVRIGPGACVRDCRLGDDTVVLANSVLEGAQVAGECTLGPFARLRPGTVLAHGARIGNFVEVKKSHIGKGSKVNHLSYIGDADVGTGVNVGCGTVTCNYDGKRKHVTVIEDGAFVGSGSTITRDTPAGKLTVGRARQVTVTGWTPPSEREE